MSTIHNPVNFVPENYVVVDYLDNKPPMADEYYYIYRADAAAQKFDLDRSYFHDSFGKYFGFTDASNKRASIPHHCVHCGSYIRYVAVAHYAPANKYVAIGTTCANRCDMSTDEHKIKNLQDIARKRAKTMALGSKYARFMSDNPDFAELVKTYEDSGVSNGFVDSVLRKLHQYGDLTPAQHEAVVKSIPRTIEQAANRKTRENADAAKREAMIDAGMRIEEGRRVIAGEVAATKIVDSMYGSTLKMLVIDDEGFKYWGTVPASIDVERGDRVTLTATVAASDDDVLFGFYKRPSKASVITPKEA